MRKKDFELLLQSVREMKAIKKGTLAPARETTITVPNVKSLRGKLKMSQSGFAALVGVSVDTLQNWEQGRRKPVGPARALLRVVELRPDVVLEALYNRAI
ncbi:MAG TPA: NadS family protein [Planctomycetota bacterium]|nr:NadS family protein [Planctomycetota bacterium]